MMDIEKLTQAPWECRLGAGGASGLWFPYIPASDKETATADAEFIALMRNDLDVQIRRGWHAEKCSEADQWFVPQFTSWVNTNGPTELSAFKAALEIAYQEKHPVGLLTKADKWLKEQESK